MKKGRERILNVLKFLSVDGRTGLDFPDLQMLENTGSTKASSSLTLHKPGLCSQCLQRVA